MARTNAARLQHTPVPVRPERIDLGLQADQLVPIATLALGDLIRAVERLLGGMDDVEPRQHLVEAEQVLVVPKALLRIRNREPAEPAAG